MLVAGAVLPHPPMLVPEIASGAAPELDELRQACFDALDALQAAEPELLVVVGAGPVERAFPRGAAGSLTPYGVDLTTRVPGNVPPSSGTDGAVDRLPLSLTVAAWLLQVHPWSGPMEFLSVPERGSAAAAASIGRELSDRSARVAVVAMGDGSAGLSEKAPAYLVPGAVQWQREVSRALASADTEQLLRWGEEQSERFAAAGLTAWQVLAGAAGSGHFAATLHHDGDPYGVGYVVASWQRQDP